MIIDENMKSAIVAELLAQDGLVAKEVDATYQGGELVFGDSECVFRPY